MWMNQINLSFSLTVVSSEFSSDVPTGSVVSSISKVSKFGFYCISCQLNPLLGGGFKGSLWIWLIFFRRIKSIHQLVQYSWIGIKKLDLFCLRWFFTDSNHRSRHHFSPPFGRIFLELFPSASVRVANPNSNHDLKTTLQRLNHEARLLGGSSHFLSG